MFAPALANTYKSAQTHEKIRKQSPRTKPGNIRFLIQKKLFSRRRAEKHTKSHTGKVMCPNPATSGACLARIAHLLTNFLCILRLSQIHTYLAPSWPRVSDDSEEAPPPSLSLSSPTASVSSSVSSGIPRQKKVVITTKRKGSTSKEMRKSHVELAIGGTCLSAHDNNDATQVPLAG